MTIEIRRSRGNVFRELGFSAEEAANLKIRSDLMIRLSKVIENRGLTQAQAAVVGRSSKGAELVLRRPRDPRPQQFLPHADRTVDRYPAECAHADTRVTPT